jgi:hypothetical protein
MLANSSLDEEMQEFAYIRNTYVPQVVLSFLSLSFVAAQFLTRDILIDSMEIVNSIADGIDNINATNEGAATAASFIAARLLKTLVHTLGLTSAEMLRLNERAMLGGKKARKMGPQGQTMQIWDPTAPMCPVEES